MCANVTVAFNGLVAAPFFFGADNDDRRRIVAGILHMGPVPLAASKWHKNVFDVSFGSRCPGNARLINVVFDWEICAFFPRDAAS